MVHRGQIPPLANLVQIDYAIWVPIAAALVVGIVHVAMRSSRSRGTDIRQSIATQRVPVFLGASFAVYLFLQLKVSDFVYRLLTPLQVINFPWRMLAFITPIGIILVAVIADHLMRRHPSRAIWWPAATVWLVSLLLLSPVFPIEGVIPGYFPISAFTAPKTIDYPTFQGYFVISGFPPGMLYPIFLPKVSASNGTEITASGALFSLYARLHKAQAGAQSLSGADCKVVGPSNAPLETLELKFSVSCSSATRLALPVSYNDYSSVFVQEAAGRLHQISYSRRPTDPRLIIDVPSRPETIVVHLPTLWGTLF